MRALFALVLAAAACGGSPKNAHDADVEYGQCLKKDWYPGVTDPHAPRVHVTVVYRDQTAKFRPKDVCLSVDGRPLLSTVDRATVIPRLELREPMTWKGTLSPGKHELAAHLRSSVEADGASHDVMAHQTRAIEAAEGLLVEITATSPDGALTLTTK